MAGSATRIIVQKVNEKFSHMRITRDLNLCISPNLFT